MRTETNIYKFDELSEEAKKKAIEWYLGDGLEYHFYKDNLDTLNSFENIFNIKVTDYSYGGYCMPHISWDFTDHDSEYIEELEYVRLLKYVINNFWNYLYKPRVKYLKAVGSNNNKERISNIFLDETCTLTGYYMDMEILNPIYNFLNNFKEPCLNYSELISECLDSFIYACNRDWEWCHSEEYAIENIKANEFEFDENGGIWW